MLRQAPFSDLVSSSLSSRQGIWRHGEDYDRILKDTLVERGHIQEVGHIADEAQEQDTD
jgi:hypothetical protein